MTSMLTSARVDALANYSSSVAASEPFFKQGTNALLQYRDREIVDRRSLG